MTGIGNCIRMKLQLSIKKIAETNDPCMVPGFTRFQSNCYKLFHFANVEFNWAEIICSEKKSAMIERFTYDSGPEILYLASLIDPMPVEEFKCVVTKITRDTVKLHTLYEKNPSIFNIFF